MISRANRSDESDPGRFGRLGLVRLLRLNAVIEASCVIREVYWLKSWHVPGTAGLQPRV